MSQLPDCLGDLKAFAHYMTAERGLAAHTVESYARDLTRFAERVGEGRFADYLSPTLAELADFVGFLHDEKLAPAEHRPRPRRL